MFDIGWQELLVIAIVLIVVVGPKDLPRMLRAFGKTMTRMRSMASDFRTQFDDALREADLDDVRKTISDAQSYNPSKTIRDVMSPLKQVGEDIRAGLSDVVKPETVREPDEDDEPVIPPTPVAEADASADSSGEAAKPAKATARKTAKAASGSGTKRKAAAASKPSARASSANGARKSAAAKGSAGKSTKSAKAGDTNSVSANGKASSGTSGGAKRNASTKTASKSRSGSGKSGRSRKAAATRPAGKTDET